MRAIEIVGFGGPEVLQLVERARPQLGAGQVLVRVLAAGVNPVDWKTRQGAGAAAYTGDPPLVLGWDVAGVIAALGSHGDDATRTGLRVGDPVLGMVGFPERGETYADYLACDPDDLVGLPLHRSMLEAGGLPLAGLTAWQSLFEHGGLAPPPADNAGRRVLIHGAAGGVGHLGVQLAKAAGAVVAATASAQNHDFLAALGADEIVDDRVQGWTERVAPVELALDCVGGQSTARIIDALVAGGRLITLPTISDPDAKARAWACRVRLERILVHRDRPQLQALCALFAEGRVRAHVSGSFGLEAARAAQEHSQTGHVRGKLVLTMT